jgi:hypothetical protein
MTLDIRTARKRRVQFYEAVGFEPSPLDAMTLMMTVGDLRAALS